MIKLDMTTKKIQEKILFHAITLGIILSLRHIAYDLTVFKKFIIQVKAYFCLPGLLCIPFIIMKGD